MQQQFLKIMLLLAMFCITWVLTQVTNKAFPNVAGKMLNKGEQPLSMSIEGVHISDGSKVLHVECTCVR